MPQATSAYEKRWARINSFGETKIPQVQRTCNDCGRPFLSGVMVVERSYVVGAKCNKCILLVPNPKKPKKWFQHA